MKGADEMAGTTAPDQEETARGKVITFYSYKGGTGRTQVANAQAALGRRERARATYDEVLDRLREVLNDNQHPAPPVCAANLAVVLEELREAEAAERLREEVLGALTARLGADHPRPRPSRVEALGPTASHA
ncbi:tetratricopeptide repeat protein [Streptomyces chartreusis]